MKDRIKVNIHVLLCHVSFDFMKVKHSVHRLRLHEGSFTFCECGYNSHKIPEKWRKQVMKSVRVRQNGLYQ